MLRSAQAPRKVFMLRCASGVTTINSVRRLARRPPERSESERQGGDIVAKDRAQIVLGDHPDIARGGAEIGQAGDGVGG